LGRPTAERLRPRCRWAAERLHLRCRLPEQDEEIEDFPALARVADAYSWTRKGPAELGVPMKVRLAITLLILVAMLVAAILSWWVVALVLALAAVVVGRWSFTGAGKTAVDGVNRPARRRK
jgi:hypothetical protein